MRNWLLYVYIGIFVLLFIGCKDVIDPGEIPDSGTNSTVTEVVVNPNAINVAKGANYLFSATVYGTNDPSQNVTWSVSGGVAGTNMNSTGLLTVAENETASALTVTATSTVDIRKKGNAIATLNVDGGTWTVHDVNTWNIAINAIRNAGNNKFFNIVVTDNILVPVTTGLLFGNGTGITVTISGAGTLTLSANGNLLRVGAGQHAIVDAVTLRGRSGNSASLIYIEAGGICTLQNNATVTENIKSGDGAGVLVIGSFIMVNAHVTNNQVSSWNSGGGVYVSGGTFTMRGTSTVANNYSYDYGGGVYVASSGRFSLENGDVTGNSSRYQGAGVYVAYNARFDMTNGNISYNTSNSNNGGGVYVYSNGTFNMHGGMITGNIANSGSGGGVYVYSNGTFVKTSGTIWGRDMGLPNSNVASNQGYVAYQSGNPNKWRNTTAGPTDRTDIYGFWLNETE